MSKQYTEILYQAIRYHQEGRLQEAEACYLKSASHRTTKAIAIGNLASLYKAQGQLERAETLFSEAIKLNPLNASILHNYAGLLCSLGRYQDAAAREEQAIKHEPNNAELHTRLGFSQWKLGELDAAVVACQRAIELNPSNITALLNLGGIYRDLQQLELALELTLQAIHIDPQCCDAQENAGVILQQLGRSADALQPLSKAQQLEPSRASVYLHLARSMEQLGQLDQAEALSRQAITLNPGNGDAYTLLSFLMFERNRIGDAIELAEHAIKLNPDDVQALSNLSSYLRAKNRLPEALAVARQAIEFQPDSSAAHCVLGSLLQSTAQFAKAKQAFEAAIACPQPNCSAFFQLSNQATPDQAQQWLAQINALEKSARPERELIDLHFAKANLLIKLGQTDTASQALKTANQLKLKRYGTDRDHYIQTTKELIENGSPAAAKAVLSERRLFIVGMVRSGSTLTESILSMNPKAQDLGETNALPVAYQQWCSGNDAFSLDQLYSERIGASDTTNAATITIDKNLYNYRFATIIGQQMPKARIIHCYRHPLDNILSMQRAHFSNGNRYASSVEDSAYVLLNQHDAMRYAKSLFPDQIYSQNYDKLVADPDHEIRRLIAWLGWPWDDRYLNPHRNERSINTASVIQARSAINARSVGGWKQFMELLEPAVAILSSHPDFQGLAKEFEQASSPKASF